MMNVDIDLKEKVIYFDPMTPLCDALELVKKEFNLSEEWRFSVKESSDDGLVSGDGLTYWVYTYNER